MKNIALVSNSNRHYQDVCIDLFDEAKPDASIVKSNHRFIIENKEGATTYHFVRSIDDVRGRIFDGFKLLHFAYDIEQLDKIVEYLETHLTPPPPSQNF